MRGTRAPLFGQTVTSNIGFLGCRHPFSMPKLFRTSHSSALLWRSSLSKHSLGRHLKLSTQVKLNFSFMSSFLSQRQILRNWIELRKYEKFSVRPGELPGREGSFRHDTWLGKGRAKASYPLRTSLILILRHAIHSTERGWLLLDFHCPALTWMTLVKLSFSAGPNLKLLHSLVQGSFSLLPYSA